MYILILSLALILQATLFSTIRLFGANPNLILVIVVSLTFFLSKEIAVIMAMMGGLLEDLFVGSMLGSNLLTLGLTIYLVTTFSSRIIRENVITPLIVILISSMGYYIMMGLLLILSGQGFLVNIHYLGTILFGSLYNMLLGILVYPTTYLVFHQSRGDRK